MKASSSGTPTSRTNAAAAKASTSSTHRSLPHNHFELFELPPAYAIDLGTLEQSYRKLQSLVHPDRYASAGEAEKRASLQWTTRVNEAYGTLKDPVQRGKHLLELRGVDVAFETDTRMPPDFLMQQMELREDLEAAIEKRDLAFLDALSGKLLSQRNALERDIAESIDEKKDYAEAAARVRKLMFLQRINAEVDAAYEAIE
jgi:molecular chaperone HscB